MKLIKARIRNFRSIEDTGEFEISDLCCLVGKNEAGKSAILDALYGTNPYREFKYEKTRDYPRRYLSKYDERHPNGHSEVAKTWWKLTTEEIALITAELGDDTVSDDIVVICSYIGRGNTWQVSIDEKKCIEEATRRIRLGASEQSQIKGINTTKELVAKISSIPDASEKLQSIKKQFSDYRDSRATLKAIDLLEKSLPKFFLTSHYDRMSGEIALGHLRECKRHNRITPGDQIFLDFIEYAGTSIEDMEDSTRYEELKAICEGASNDITDEIFQFWSQNDAISVKIDLGEGRTDDPAPFNQGTIAKIRIWNDHHRASIPLSERSAGFVWFFSFLSQFKQLSKTAGSVVLLLDEPGLTLHGKAQTDLLSYIKQRLLSTHQVIYTTHSPFLVPANELQNVRVVEDVIKYMPSSPRPEVVGTKVSSEILSVNKDTLFPLRSHLGYEIAQSLFVGENTILVEGPSDILYLQAVSHALRSRNREALDNRWVLCPSGGVDKVFAFVSLFSGNNLNIAVLTDFSDGDKSRISRLKQSQILSASQIFTTSDFLGKNESDIEDFFTTELFLRIVNRAYDIPNTFVLKPDSLPEISTERIVKRVEAAFRTLQCELSDFDHFTPSAYLLKHPELLEGDSPEVDLTLTNFERLFNKLNSLVRN